GEGVRILRGVSSSPTWQLQQAGFLARFPAARVHWHEAVNRDNVYDGAQHAFGRAVDPVYHFERARVVVALDADFLGSLVGHVRYARDFARTRRPEEGTMSRLYAAECSPSITGASADHFLALPAAEISVLAERLWEAVRNPGSLSDNPWLRLALQDLA